MSTAEEFILVPKKVYMKSQPYQTQVLEDPDVKHKSAQLSIINRMRSKEHSEVQTNKKLPEEDTDVNVVNENRAENSNKRAVQVLKTLSSLLPNSKFLKCENIVDLIKKSNRVSIGEDENLLIDNSPTDINAFAFLYNLQQPTKKIDSPDYFELLKVLQIKEEQVMLKLRSGKILQKLQLKEKMSSKDHRNKNVQSFKSLKNLTTRTATVQQSTPHRRQ